MSRGNATIACALLLGVLAAPLAGCGDERPGGGRVAPAAIALDFVPGAVHAGVYETVRGGHDRANGVMLRIRVPSASADSLKLLALGRADVAIVDIHDLGLALERGADLVGVGAIVQRPLAAVIARAGIRRPRELEGRRVGVTGLPSDEAVLRAVVEADGGRFAKVRRVTIGFSAVPSLIAGKVDAVTAFWNAEGVVLRRRRFPTREFRLDAFGAPRFPELVLVTRRETLRRKRRLVTGIVAALRAGTDAAYEDGRPALREVARAAGADEALIRAQFAAVRSALRPALTLEPRALDGWAEFDARFGIVRRRPDPRRAFAFDLSTAR